MDMCTRQQLYDEALSLYQFGKSLVERHGSIAIVNMLGKELESVLQFLSTQLLNDLQGQLQLSQCLKIIGHIKRLELFSEMVCFFY